MEREQSKPEEAVAVAVAAASETDDGKTRPILTLPNDDYARSNALSAAIMLNEENKKKKKQKKKKKKEPFSFPSHFCAWLCYVLASNNVNQ